MTDINKPRAAHKIAVVTGSSRGLGHSVVENLAERGVDIMFTYHSNQADANNVTTAVEKKGRKVAALKLDTGKVSAFDGFVDNVRATLADFGADRFDYLVNNAGISHHAAFDKVTEQDLDELYNVHLKGVFFLTQKLLPLINDGGRIVNYSSGLTRIIYPGSAGYAAIKGAVEVLTRYLAKELGPRRIAVNVVAPGAIATDFSGGMVRDNPEINKQVGAMTALGRVGLPDDVGMMVAALLLRGQSLGQCSTHRSLRWHGNLIE